MLHSQGKRLTVPICRSRELSTPKKGIVQELSLKIKFCRILHFTEKKI